MMNKTIHSAISGYTLRREDEAKENTRKINEKQTEYIYF